MNDIDQLAVDNADSYNEMVAQLFVFRKDSGLEVSDVALLTGSTIEEIISFEAGHGNPTIRFIMNYAEAVKAYLSFTAVNPEHLREWRDRSRNNTIQLDNI